MPGMLQYTVSVVDPTSMIALQQQHSNKHASLATVFSNLAAVFGNLATVFNNLKTVFGSLETSMSELPQYIVAQQQALGPQQNSGKA